MAYERKTGKKFSRKARKERKGNLDPKAFLVKNQKANRGLGFSWRPLRALREMLFASGLTG